MGILPISRLADACKHVLPLHCNMGISQPTTALIGAPASPICMVKILVMGIGRVCLLARLGFSRTLSLELV